MRIKKNPLISICIPTYNRPKYLKRLFDSVVESQCDIEFSIVNDGSSLCYDFLDEYTSKYLIKYVYQHNTGRANALRKSILQSSGDYVIIMDDEDFFLKNSIQVMIDSIKKMSLVNSKKPLAGLIFDCLDTNFELLGASINNPKNNCVDLLSCYVRYGCKGDKKQLIKSNLLKEVLYPESLEKRMPTSLLWIRLSLSYDVIYVNQPVAVKEYLDNGYSKKLLELQLKSPRNTILAYKEAIKFPRYDIYFMIFRLKKIYQLLRFLIYKRILC